MASEIVRLDPDHRRIIAAIAHVISMATEMGTSVTQYDILKSIFLADRSHLNEWGRLITSDNYVAMVHGPVPSLTYDFLKGNERKLRDYHLEALPWVKVQGDRTKFFYRDADANMYADYLSDTDRDALETALGIVKRLGFGQVRKLTHEDAAYLDAWEEDGGRAAYDMSLAMMFDRPNFEMAREIGEYSPYVHAG